MFFVFFWGEQVFQTCPKVALGTVVWTLDLYSNSTWMVKHLQMDSTGVLRASKMEALGRGTEETRRSAVP